MCTLCNLPAIKTAKTCSSNNTLALLATIMVIAFFPLLRFSPYVITGVIFQFLEKQIVFIIKFSYISMWHLTEQRMQVL